MLNGCVCACDLLYLNRIKEFGSCAYYLRDIQLLNRINDVFDNPVLAEDLLVYYLLLWVTTNVVKPSATGQPTRPTQPFILSGSISE